MNYARILASRIQEEHRTFSKYRNQLLYQSAGRCSCNKQNGGEEDALHGKVYRNQIITFYARHGDYIGFISAFLTCSILLYFWVRIEWFLHLFTNSSADFLRIPA